MKKLYKMGISNEKRCKNKVFITNIMKCLITRITGFLGPHLAKKLIKEGHNVFGF